MWLSTQEVGLSWIVYIYNPGGILYHLIDPEEVLQAKTYFNGKHRLIKLGFIIWFTFISQNLDIAMLLLLI